MNSQDKNNIKNMEKNGSQNNAPNQMNSSGANSNYSDSEGKNGGPAPNIPRGPNIFNIIIVMFLITSLINTFFIDRANRSLQAVEYSQFIELVDSGNVGQVLLSDSQLLITIDTSANLGEVEKILYPSGRAETQPAPAAGDNYIAVRVDDPDLVNRLSSNDVAFSQVENTTGNASPLKSFVSMWIIPTLIMYLIYFFGIRNLMKRIGQNQSGGKFGGILGVGKSKAKEYNLEKNTGVTFDDVAGQDEAKESLMEMVDFLHNPEKYRAIGAKQPKGALLVGPPGTGKTLLAKAVAGESGVPFYSISGSEFVEMFVGVGASRVRDLFENAQKNAPCIIFIDEIDAIGKSRDNQMGSNDEREQTLNQLLAEMDGFDSGKGIVILAATNRPEVLDKALLRPGRFDRRIIVDKPELSGREAILKVHAAKVKMDPNVNLRDIALATGGATGADLANMVNEGALLAVKEGRETVTQYGMSDRFGPMGLESTQNQYLDGRSVGHYSEQTGTLIDEEVRNILARCQEEANKLLEANRDALEKISAYLLEKENITGQEFMQLLEKSSN